MIIFGSPSRYHQGPDCLDRLGEILATVGTRFVIVGDAFILPMLEVRLRRALGDAPGNCLILPFTGDVTPKTIDQLVADVSASPIAGQVDAVIGLGGGKAIDSGKALAHRLKCAVVTIPTAATNDAPTSKNFVIYDENHVLLEVINLPANPAAVIVDTTIIAGAPASLLTSGIGDAITKSFEAAQCLKNGGRNMFGSAPSRSAAALAEEAYRIVRATAREGLATAGTGTSNPAFEALMEALFLMGGLGFESGGLCIAHAATRGLSRVPGAATAMHGHQVAYGLLVQLTLERRDDAFMADMRSFYDAVRLPTSLRALGVDEPTDEIFRIVAGPTLAAPHAANFERPLSEADLVAAMRTVESDSAAADTF